jgi:NAD(P)-dependent dehydrogenase (short-subunit alcohol dehydrogenase family)
MKIITQTRRQLLQSTSALAFAAILPGCASLNKGGGGPGISPYPKLLADIPLSDYGFATTADQVVAGMDLSGKTVLITGCNSGLGYESLRSLAGAGAHVIGTARTMAKAETACASVGGKTTPLVCELTDMKSVVACANAVNGIDSPIDILMCNAGIMALPQLEQIDINGNLLEKQFVVNHLGHYLLTRRLLPQVQSSRAGRIVMVSSVGYTLAPKGGIQFDDLSASIKYKPFPAYGQTKLANVLFSNELSRRYADSVLTSNAIHPGLVSTNLGRYMRGGNEAGEVTPKNPDKPLRKGMKSADQGAATQVYVATDPRLKGVSGYYFEDSNPVALKGSYARDTKLARQLWDVSEDLVSPYL